MTRRKSAGLVPLIRNTFLVHVQPVGPCGREFSAAANDELTAYSEGRTNEEEEKEAREENVREAKIKKGKPRKRKEDRNRKAKREEGSTRMGKKERDEGIGRDWGCLYV